MECPVTSPVWSAVVLHPADDVAVALRPLEPGPISLRSGDAAETFEVRAAIPLGHKFALRDIPVGADVRKYGEVIGIATTAIARGTHVHVQNLIGRRAAFRRHCLTDPAARPEVIRVCSGRNSSNVGSVVRADPAMTWPHSTMFSPK